MKLKCRNRRIKSQKSPSVSPPLDLVSKTGKMQHTVFIMDLKTSDFKIFILILVKSRNVSSRMISKDCNLCYCVPQVLLLPFASFGHGTIIKSNQFWRNNLSSVTEQDLHGNSVHKLASMRIFGIIC